MPTPFMDFALLIYQSIVVEIAQYSIQLVWFDVQVWKKMISELPHESLESCDLVPNHEPNLFPVGGVGYTD